MVHGKVVRRKADGDDEGVGSGDDVVLQGVLDEELGGEGDEVARGEVGGELGRDGLVVLLGDG